MKTEHIKVIATTSKALKMVADDIPEANGKDKLSMSKSRVLDLHAKRELKEISQRLNKLGLEMVF